ncbi:hypothetical protein MG293_015490 [Ovis ammon polii]|uniref:Uncharacterized protein n=1 Tax=Ovis ammon polii TaxID=230172 RepID=A0AAD4TYX6_OVIAM|nr:hypothetical protein MG293_015490 [Ovis ammon polii]KAI4558501.1 hypothetical protein MJT46_013143 [Ovis ammon polii x Ovis aries]
MAPQLGLFLIWAGVSVILQLHPVNGDDELTRDKSSEESHEGSVPGADPQDDPQGKRTTRKEQPSATN